MANNNSINRAIAQNIAIKKILDTSNDCNNTWSTLAVSSRVGELKKLRILIAEMADEITDVIAVSTHRPRFEVLSQEVLPVLEMAKYCGRNMSSWIRPRNQRYLKPGFAGSKQTLYFQPCGTVAVIMPSNFPFSLGVMSAFYLAAAGNTVILKPSEKLPAIAKLLKQLIRMSGLSDGVIEVVEEGPEAVKVMIESGMINKLFFFGSAASGLKVQKQCFEQQIPCVLETGSGSAAIVDENSDLRRAVAGLAWSAFYDRGYSCVGTRVLFVHENMRNQFLEKFITESHRICQEYEVKLQLEKEAVDKINWALKRGAEFYDLPQNGQRGPGVLAVSLDDPLLLKPIWGPVVVFSSFGHLDVAIQKVNSCKNLLGTSIWSNDRRRARNLIKKLYTNMNWINDASLGLPNLPWSDKNQNSQGGLFSEYALQEAGRWKWVIETPGIMKRSWWHPYTTLKVKLAKMVARLYRV